MTRNQSVATPEQRVVFAADESVLPESRQVADGPDPKFGDFPRWDLIAGGLAPNLAPFRAQLRFDDIPDDWRLTARTLAMAIASADPPSPSRCRHLPFEPAAESEDYPDGSS